MFAVTELEGWSALAKLFLSFYPLGLGRKKSWSSMLTMLLAQVSKTFLNNFISNIHFLLWDS